MLPVAVYTQPGSNMGLGDPPGVAPVNGIIVRTLQDTPADAEFAGPLTVEAFRGKIAHNVTERKLPIVTKNMVAQHRGQPESFYRRTFVAELEGRPVGLISIRFKGDQEMDKSDHLSELGCWHFCRFACFGIVANSEDVKQRECYVSHICVNEFARGKGVGKLLLDRADYEARLRNCTNIYLYVLTNNRAQNLYVRQGYRITSTDTCCGCLGCCFGPPGKVYKMEKNL